MRHNQLTSALHLIHRKIDALGGELKIFMTLLLEQGEGLFEQSAEMQAELLNTLSPLVDMAQKASSTTFAIALKDINGATADLGARVELLVPVENAASDDMIAAATKGALNLIAPA